MRDSSLSSRVSGVGALVWWAGSTYLAYSALTLFGILSGTLFAYLYFAWPYASMLAFQKFIDPGSTASALSFFVAGGLIVLSIAFLLRRQFGRRSRVVVALVGVAICGSTIAILSIGSRFLAQALGWPYGE